MSRSRFFPFHRYTVTGESMLPHYRPGDVVIVWKKTHVRAGDVVVCEDPRTPEFRILKRVVDVREDGYEVRGDNESESTDSRAFGSITRNDIVGEVVYPKKSLSPC